MDFLIVIGLAALMIWEAHQIIALVLVCYKKKDIVAQSIVEVEYIATTAAANHAV